MSRQRRNLERRHLIFYLGVYDLDHDGLLGYLVDISSGGFMLMSDKPIREGAEFRVRMLLPEHGKYGVPFEVDAVCMWCRQGPNPSLYDAGFQMEELSDNARVSLRMVIEELGFGRH